MYVFLFFFTARAESTMLEVRYAAWLQRAIFYVECRCRTMADSLGLNTILPLPILYGIYCNKRGSGGYNILRNSMGDGGR